MTKMTMMTKAELEGAPYDRLVIAAPTVDITNIDTSKMKSSDNTEELKKKVATSCLNMISIAQKAIIAHPKLKNVTIMNHAPRFDYYYY